MPDGGKLGVIHEIGDMGLGYTELTEQEKQQIRKNDEAKKDAK